MDLVLLSLPLLRMSLIPFQWRQLFSLNCAQLWLDDAITAINLFLFLSLSSNRFSCDFFFYRFISTLLQLLLLIIMIYEFTALHWPLLIVSIMISEMNEERKKSITQNVTSKNNPAFIFQLQAINQKLSM